MAPSQILVGEYKCHTDLIGFYGSIGRFEALAPGREVPEGSPWGPAIAVSSKQRAEHSFMFPVDHVEEVK